MFWFVKSEKLTGEENDKAHSSLWTRSPGCGTRIVDKTDFNISPTSAMTRSLVALSSGIPAFLSLNPKSLDSPAQLSVR